MMMALGAILLVTALGVTSLTLASSDNKLSGSTLDIKTSEEAAMAGLREVLGRMEANPVTAVAQLQQYVNELDKTPKHEWFVPSGTTISLSTTEPSPFPIDGTNNSWKARILGVDVGGAHGTTSDRGIQVAIQVDGYGRNGSVRRMIGTYRMRGIAIDVVVNTPGETDQYALYVNGTMGNSTIAINIKGDVYVSGDIFLDAGMGNKLTIDSTLRAAGNFKPLSEVLVKGNAYIGGCIDQGAHGTTTFLSHLGVEEGYCTISAPFSVGGSFNLYGTNRTNWTEDLYVGGEQFYVRDQTWNVGAKTYVTNGSAFFAKSVVTGGDGMEVDEDLEVGGTVAATLGGTVTVGGQAGFRNTGGVSFLSQGTIQDDAYFASPLRVGTTKTASLFVGGNAFLAQGIANISGNFQINGDVRLDAAAQGTFGKDNLLTASTGTLTMNGGLAPTFGSNANERWVVKFWSYQNLTELSGTRINSSTSVTGAYPGGPWRTTALDVLSGTAPQRTPKALADPSVPNLGYTVHDTMIELKDNMPNEVYMGKTLEQSMVKMSEIWTAAGLPAPSTSTYEITDKGYNKLYDYLSTNNKLYNGYMVVLIDKNLIMDCSSPIEPFHGKSLLVVESKISADPTKNTESWAPSKTDTNVQVLYVRGAGEILDFGIPQASPYDFYGYIHYENNFKGNHAWFEDSKMHGSIYMAGADANILGANKSRLTLIYDQDVMKDIQDNLSLIWKYGTKPDANVTESSSRVLSLKETWVQFDLISLTR